MFFHKPQGLPLPPKKENLQFKSARLCGGPGISKKGIGGSQRKGDPFPGLGELSQVGMGELKAGPAVGGRCEACWPEMHMQRSADEKEPGLRGEEGRQGAAGGSRSKRNLIVAVINSVRLSFSRARPVGGDIPSSI